MKKLLVAGVVPALLACVLAGCGDGKQTAKTEYAPRDVKALVQKAYDYVQANGKDAALEEFMNKNGEFVKGELYIYAYKMDGTVISHGGDPSLVGRNIITYKDPNGVLAVQDAANLAKTKGSGWLLCMFPNPETKQQQDKLIYVRKVDDDWFIGSGLYL